MLPEWSMGGKRRGGENRESEKDANSQKIHMEGLAFVKLDSTPATPSIGDASC